VRIRSLDPKAPPVIEPNYLGDPADLATLMAAVRLARRIAAQPALRAVAPTVLAPDATVQSDDALATFVRRSLRTFKLPAPLARRPPSNPDRLVYFFGVP
jgi:choline dehydrogenase